MPINFLSVAASTPEDLDGHAKSPRGEYVKLRHAALQRYMREDGQEVNECVKKLWESRHAETSFVVRVYEAAGVPVADLTPQERQERDTFFSKSVKVWTGIKVVLTQLEHVMVGPHTLGMLFPQVSQRRT